MEIQGANATHRLALAEHPLAGSDTLRLSGVPVGWDVGDQIVITGTEGATSDEVRVIQAIDGTTVSLDQPLSRDHVPPKSDLTVYAANTTRNVQFVSENPAVANRGHIMFMHNPNVKVSGASFVDLGRTDKSKPLDDVFFEFDEDAVGNNTSAAVVFSTTTGPSTNVRGRYAVHFHRGGNDPLSSAALIDNSVVMGSPGWGFVNHSSHVNMTNNVAYGVQGASFYTESGDEIGSMVGNIAIRTVSPAFTLDDGGAIDPDLRADVQDFGVDGDGYWLSGHLVSLRDNVAAGATGHGIIIWSDGLVEADRGRATVKTSDIANGNLITGRDTIPTWWAPLAEIKDNESFGATIGFRSRYVHSSGYLGEPGSTFHEPPDQAYIDTLKPTIDGLTVWGSRDGVLMNYNERMSLKNARLIGTGAPYVQNGGTADTGVGIDLYNEVTRGPGVIENVTVEGFNMGILAPRQDHWQLNNIELRNTTDMLITEARQAARQLEMTNVRFGDLQGTAVSGNEAQRRNIVMDADLEADGHQPYWFLLSDRITLNDQSLYFNEQAANHIPLTELDQSQLVAPVSNEFVGLTNQQLSDTYGTSFGGAIAPADAVSVDLVEGGLVGSIATTTPTTPPLYHMASEGEYGILVDPGTLTNFGGAVPGPGNGGDEPDEDETGEEESDDDSENEDSEEEDSEEEDSEEDESDEEESDEEESDEEESDEEDSEEEDSEDDDSDEEDSHEDDADEEDSHEDDTDEEDSDEEDLEDDDSEEGDSDDEESDEEAFEDEESEDEMDDEASDEGAANEEGSCDASEEGEDSDDDEVEVDPQNEDIFAVSATLVGTDESEKLQGFESDDSVTGGGGPDLFPLTTGNDVITDFDPLEDMIDVGDFARESDGFAVLTSLDDIAANATETMLDGQIALVIDVDGAEGDSTTTLMGTSLSDLSLTNVFFGLDGESIPPLEFTHIPKTTVLLSEGTVAEFAAHDLSVHPLPFELVSGNQLSVDVMNGLADDSHQQPSDSTDVNNDGITTAADALVVINFLSNHGAGLIRDLANVLKDYVDVDGNGGVSALDALHIINYLNQAIDSQNSNDLEHTDHHGECDESVDDEDGELGEIDEEFEEDDSNSSDSESDDEPSGSSLLNQVFVDDDFGEDLIDEDLLTELVNESPVDFRV